MRKTNLVRFAAFLCVPALLAIGGCKADRVEKDGVAVTKTCTGEGAGAEGKTCNAKGTCDKDAAKAATKTN